jgi:pentalenene oxygenase
MRTLLSIPTAPGALPLVGHLLQLVRNPQTFLASLPAHGELVGIRLGPVPAVVACSPDLVRQVLLDDRTFDKGGPFYDGSRHIAPDNLIHCPHSRHRRLRRLVQPAFHHERFPGYAEVMTTQIAAMVDSWQDNEILDVLREMFTLTMNVTLETMFSSALPAQATRAAIEDITTLLAGVYRRTVMPTWANRAPTPSNRRYNRALTRIRNTMETITTERRQSGTDHGDLLSALLGAHETTTENTSGGGTVLSDSEVVDQLILFLVGGTETTAVTLAWAFHLLASHPDIADRLHAEVDSVLPDGIATFDHLPRLELTRRVITETLRLYPPAWINTRIVTSDVELDGHHLPADTTVLLSPYLIHHRRDLFDHPETFDPDRWDPQRPQPPRHAFIPFAAAARKCLGDTFALTEATLALATVTAHWQLRALPGQRVSAAAQATLRPRGIHMRATTRTSVNSPNGQ